MLGKLAFGGVGLTQLKLLDLTRLLSAVHRGALTCPIGTLGLHIAGLNYLEDRVDFLKGLDEHAVRAVLVAVIAERKLGPKGAT
jgi:hypothetical protein